MADETTTAYAVLGDEVEENEESDSESAAAVETRAAARGDAGPSKRRKREAADGGGVPVAASALATPASREAQVCTVDLKTCDFYFRLSVPAAISIFQLLSHSSTVPIKVHSDRVVSMFDSERMNNVTVALRLVPSDFTASGGQFYVDAGAGKDHEYSFGIQPAMVLAVLRSASGASVEIYKIRDSACITIQSGPWKSLINMIDSDNLRMGLKDVKGFDKELLEYEVQVDAHALHTHLDNCRAPNMKQRVRETRVTLSFTPTVIDLSTDWPIKRRCILALRENEQSHAQMAAKSGVYTPHDYSTVKAITSKPNAQPCSKSFDLRSLKTIIQSLMDMTPTVDLKVGCSTALVVNAKLKDGGQCVAWVADIVIDE